jgi:tetratricopeptide (TPR) repeat protein
VSRARLNTPSSVLSHPYGVADVEKLLGLPRSTVRSLILAGFVTPTRGVRNAWLFSFQDLIVLRTAQALSNAKVPARRITKSLKELRRHLPETMPLSGLNICAIADRVVIREGGSHWQAESGQYLLAFEGDPADGSLSVIERTQPMVARSGRKEASSAENDLPSAQEWFDRGAAAERADPNTALNAYGRAIAVDPAFVDAHINLGRLLHEAGRFAQAEQVYREAMKACGEDPLLLYNLGVLLDDMDRKMPALVAYEAALRGDPGLADCHYNLALLYEKLAKPQEAIRHMSRYRTLIGAGSKSR